MNATYQRYRKTYKAYRIKNRELCARLKREWKENNEEYCKKYRRKNDGIRRFGRDTLEILSTLGNTCSLCGMTNRTHVKRYGRSLSVHHKDGKGRNHPTPNNSVINFELLCLPCHFKEHAVYKLSPKYGRAGK